LEGYPSNGYPWRRPEVLGKCENLRFPGPAGGSEGAELGIQCGCVAAVARAVAKVAQGPAVACSFEVGQGTLREPVVGLVAGPVGAQLGSHQAGDLGVELPALDVEGFGVFLSGWGVFFVCVPSWWCFGSPAGEDCFTLAAVGGFLLELFGSEAFPALAFAGHFVDHGVLLTILCGLLVPAGIAAGGSAPAGDVAGGPSAQLGGSVGELLASVVVPCSPLGEAHQVGDRCGEEEK
jgi:hypothetical protein